MNNHMPLDLKKKIQSDIKSKLSPAWIRVFIKLAIIQFFASFIVLSICPQFDLGFNPHSFLGHILMSWGELACNIACGAIFLGLGSVISVFILNHDELRVLRKIELPSFTSIGAIALICFMIFGVKFQFVMFMAWLTGAVLSAVLGLEVFWRIKKFS